MNILDQDYASGIFDEQNPPCLSLYQPTHRSFPDNQQDPIRFRNLVKDLEKSLRRKYDEKETKQLLKPFAELAEDAEFWNHSGDGLIVLGADSFFRVYRVQRPVSELAVVADSFHLKPLLRILQSADRYHVLALSRKEVNLYEGNRDEIAQVSLSEAASEIIENSRIENRKEPHREVSAANPNPGTIGVRGGQDPSKAADHDTERFFRAVERAILEHYSRPSGLPLILAGLQENLELFRRLSRNTLVVENGIEANPDTLSVEELREKAWQMMKPHYIGRLEGLIDLFRKAQSKELGNDHLNEVMQAAADGRIATVLIEADRQIPGCINTDTGEIEFAELENPEVDDLLDDLGEKVLKSGGQVVIVPKDEMPTDTGLAAIYRF